VRLQASTPLKRMMTGAKPGIIRHVSGEDHQMDRWVDEHLQTMEAKVAATDVRATADA
jgi:hypothetical protein